MSEQHDKLKAIASKQTALLDLSLKVITKEKAMYVQDVNNKSSTDAAVTQKDKFSRLILSQNLNRGHRQLQVFPFRISYSTSKIDLSSLHLPLSPVSPFMAHSSHLEHQLPLSETTGHPKALSKCLQNTSVEHTHQAAPGASRTWELTHSTPIIPCTGFSLSTPASPTGRKAAF